MIEPDAHWYGTYARRSAIADYLELLAISGRTLTVEELADRIRDNKWARILGDRIDKPLEPEEDDEQIAAEIDLAEDRARDVLSVVAERQEFAQPQYPFAVDGLGRLTFMSEDQPSGLPYIRLLCITVAHATKVALQPRAHEVFELMVTGAFLKMGLATVGIGAESRAGGVWTEVLTRSCDRVGLNAYPERALAKVFANDEGADILSNVWSGDRRSGGLQLVGQVTCARSDEWDKKIQEPAPLQWRDWLGGMRQPSVYLAVPHHVEELTRCYLVSKRDRDIVDRLRLTPMLTAEPVAGEAELVAAVLAEEVV